MSLVPTNKGGSGGVVQAAPDAPCTEPLSGTAVEVYQPTALSRLEEGERMLAAIVTAPDALKVIAYADAARVWVKHSKLGIALINHATVIAIRAEQRLAECVDQGQARGEIATQGKLPKTGGLGPLTLTQLGTTPQRLDEARKLRSLSPEDLAAAARKAEIEDKPLSRGTFLREIEKPARNARRSALVTNANPGLPDGPFQVFYADPPWRYEHVETENRAIENQYPTMALEDICALPVAERATDDAILFLWATNPKTTEADKVITAWGFTHRTNMVWVKDRIGMGYYVREQHELLLIARRGEFPPPPTDLCPSSVLMAPRGRHSEKPDAFAELIERMYPDASRVELFARRARPGWYAWGNQVE